jgi:hypothetical protein
MAVPEAEQGVAGSFFNTVLQVRSKSLPAL